MYEKINMVEGEDTKWKLVENLKHKMELKSIIYKLSALICMTTIYNTSYEIFDVIIQ